MPRPFHFVILSGAAFFAAESKDPYSYKTYTVEQIRHPVTLCHPERRRVLCGKADASLRITKWNES